MSSQLITLWIRSILACSLLIQSFEMLSIAKSITPEHPWSWQNSFPSFQHKKGLIYQSLRILFENKFSSLIMAQIFLVILLPFFNSPLLILSLSLSALLINVRFRGVFNGGSDYMTMVTLLGLLASSIILENDLPSRWGLYYIGIQCILSYFIAGVVKIKNSTWRNGQALKIFISSTNYAVPAKIKQIAHSNILLIAASWFVMMWECLFPLCWLWPKTTPFFLGIAFVFHIGNFICFGINRFVFAWLAAYPAVLYCTNSI